jgi:dihydrofolate reductase
MIRLIVACDARQGISKDGGLPWHLPDDLAYFARMTNLYGGQVLMGGVTYRTLAGPLKNRQNFVLTHGRLPIPGVSIVHDLPTFLAEFKDRDLWVIGGADVFSQVLAADVVDEIYLTHIESDFECTQFFPIMPDTFHLVERSDAQHQNGLTFYYKIYKHN